MIVLDPVATFFVYIGAIGLILTVVAAIADLWLAHDQRRERDQARAEARAKRRKEMEASGLLSPSSSSQ